MRCVGVPSAWARTGAVCVTLLVVAGCAKLPQIGMESPGRPAVSWKTEREASAEAAPTPAEGDTEHRLLAEVHAAEGAGSDNLALAQALYNLAILRRQQGQLPAAAELYQRALAIREREQGTDHPDVATTLNNLAGIEAAQGNYDGAQPLLERALKIRQGALGATHPLTAQSMNNLALLYAAQGNATAAEPLYQSALAILEKSDTTEAADIGRVLENYAALLHDTGRDGEAEQLETRARVRRIVPEE
jgi:tetratricopeptide (TPR) repeat protein